jgi:hypothetical protein
MPKLAQPEATAILPLDCIRTTGMKRNLAKSDGQWPRLSRRQAPAGQALSNVRGSPMPPVLARRIGLHDSLPLIATKKIWPAWLRRAPKAPETQGVRPTFQTTFFNTTFSSSNPLTPATQSVSECAGTSERERVSILTSLQSWIVTLVNYLACVAGGSSPASSPASPRRSPRYFSRHPASPYRSVWNKAPQ